MTNVVSLVDDAAMLAEQSPARARSLLILAQEETGKAHVIYDAAQSAWTEGLPVVELPPRFRRLERLHQPKIIASMELEEELPSFWGDYSTIEPLADLTMEQLDGHLKARSAERALSAGEVNRRKQAGFYVDRDDDQITTPQTVQVTPSDLVHELMRTAAVAEMLLISDHSRMKLDSPDRYDSTRDLQTRLLPYAHPLMA